MVVDLSEAALHNIIHSNCPTLERLLLVFAMEICIRCLKIKSPHLVSMGICFLDMISSSKMPLHFKGCSTLNWRPWVPSQITIVSAPKLETLGAIRDPFRWFNMVFGSTPIEVLYIIHVNFCDLSISFVRISFISSWSTLCVLILCYMLNE